MIGIFDAKTHFSAIMEKVLQGKEFLITRRGQPIAKITAVDGRSNERIEKAVNAMLLFGKGRKSSQAQSKSFIEEGRKW